MNYYGNNDWWGYLAHARKAQERPDHKYVARVEIGVKKGKTLYRYFYSQKEYEAYLKEQNDSVKGKPSMPSNVQKLVEGTKRLLSEIKQETKKITTNVDSRIRKLLKMEPREQTVDRGKDYVEKHVSAADKMRKAAEHKYIAKVDLGNGKYRYFYTQDDYDRYLARQEYQANEPDFMKDVPKISITDTDTKNQDQSDINEDFDPYVIDRSQNCMYCTTAYELRQRGYDVQAKICDENYQGTLFHPETWYKNADIELIREDGSLTDMNPYTDSGSVKRTKDGKVATQEQMFVAEAATYWNYTYTEDALRNAIRDNNPPNSRGNLIVMWRGNGGHSMVYEVDKHKNVIIRDCQNNQIYTMADLAPYIRQAYFIRTDNLELNEAILTTVEAN